MPLAGCRGGAPCPGSRGRDHWTTIKKIYHLFALGDGVSICQTSAGYGFRLSIRIAIKHADIRTVYHKFIPFDINCLPRPLQTFGEKGIIAVFKPIFSITIADDRIFCSDINALNVGELRF